MAEKLKYPPSPALGVWLTRASKEMRDRLFEISSRSEDMFRQWVTGRRAPSAASAGDVEACTKQIADEFTDAPPPLRRGDLCEACRNCEYYQAIAALPDVTDEDSNIDLA